MFRKSIVLVGIFLLGMGMFSVTRAQTADMWNAIYFSEWLYQGETAQQTIAGHDLQLDWGMDAPADGIPSDFFSARFTRGIDVDEAARYEFVTSGDDGYQVFLNGDLIVDQSSASPLSVDRTKVDLAAGRHILTVEYYEAIGNASLNVSYYALGEAPDAPRDPFLTPLALFEADLQRTILAKEFDQLASFMSDPFSIGVFASEFAPLTPEDAVADFETRFADATGAFFDEEADFSDLLQRDDPAGVFGPNAVGVLNLKTEQNQEMILGINQRVDGSFYWSGTIFGPFKFDVPDPMDGGTEAPNDVPAAYEDVIDWIVSERANGTSATSVSAHLLAADRLALEYYFRVVDLNGDGEDEWAITLKETEGFVAARLFGGDFVVVNETGVVYLAEGGEFYSAPEVEETADFTGDGTPDLVISTTTCGANTCFSTYDIIGANNNNDIGSLIAFFGEDGPIDSFATVSIKEMTVDTLPDLVIRSGGVGSVGAGSVQRFRTQIWTFHPQSQTIILDRVEQDPSNLRYHLLVEANELYQSGQLDAAEEKYLQVVLDESLEDVSGFIKPDETTYDTSRQFAAFRMMLIDQLQNDVPAHESADGRGAPDSSRKDWLVFNYPDAPITDGAVQFFIDFFISEDVESACATATSVLEDYENPAGAIEDMGFVWPLLDAQSICVLPG